MLASSSLYDNEPKKPTEDTVLLSHLLGSTIEAMPTDNFEGISLRTDVEHDINFHHEVRIKDFNTKEQSEVTMKDFDVEREMAISVRTALSQASDEQLSRIFDKLNCVSYDTFLVAAMGAVKTALYHEAIEKYNLHPHIWQIAGKTLIFFTPEDRNTLYKVAETYVDRSLPLYEERVNIQKNYKASHATEGVDSGEICATLAEQQTALEWHFRSASIQQTTLHPELSANRKQQLDILKAIYAIQQEIGMPFQERPDAEQFNIMKNSFLLSASTEHEPIPEAELMLQHLSQKSNSH